LNQTNKDIAKGAAWMVLFKFIDRGIGLASTLVLARLLAPADFGLIAIAMMLINALTLLVAFNFDVHLIQNKHAGRDQFDTAFTFNLIFNCLLALALVALGGPASAFYREPRLAGVMDVLALGMAIQGLNNVGLVQFRREMRFDREFRFQLAKRVAPVLVTIPVALWLHSYWALALGQLAGTCGTVLLSYLMSTYRPRLSLAARAELFHSSKWLLVNNTLEFLNGRAAELVIGRFAGAAGVGVYTISSEVATLPTTELVAPINRAAFPGYARLAHELPALRASFLTVISMIALFAIPAGLGIAVVADLMVPAVLGPRWLHAIPLIRILAVYGMLGALHTNIAYVYLAVGRQRLISVVLGTHFAVLVALLVPATWRYGALGAAWSFLATAVLMMPVNQFLITRQLQLSSFGYLARTWRPTAAGVCMVLAVLAFKTALAPQGAPAYAAALLAAVIVGAAAYALALFGLWQLCGRRDGAERVSLDGLARVWRRAGQRLGWA
jgi:O-antigen/teichoic acid export membrane protein